MLDTLALVVGERAFAKLEPALMLLDLVVEVRPTYFLSLQRDDGGRNCAVGSRNRS